MDSILNYILASNSEYADRFGDSAKLAAAPAKKVAILTCMDARLDPLRFAGLSLGDAHIIRNAGGRASDDAIRSLVISSKFLGTREWVVIQHTHCGMQSLTNETIQKLFSTSLGPAVKEGDTWKNVEEEGGSVEGTYINWLTISELNESVTSDVTRIRNHPLVPKYVAIYGYIFDVKTGRLIEVPEANQIGKPKEK